MSIRDDILEFRRQQVDEDHHLVLMPDKLLLSGLSRLEELKGELLNNPEEFENLRLEGANIREAIGDIRDIRGWLLFQLAWSEQGERSTMTGEEFRAYEQLVSIGKAIRGEA